MMRVLSTAAPLALAVTLCLALAGCTAGGSGPSTSAPADGGTTSASPPGATSPSPTPSPSPTASPTPSPEPPSQHASPDLSMFPDPTSLVGASFREAVDEAGTWSMVIDGSPIGLGSLGGSCYQGGTDDVCAYALHTAVEPWTGSEPTPFQAALLFLLQAAEPAADGSPQWTVLDAVLTTNPSGEPGWLTACESTSGAQIWVPDDVEWGMDDYPVAGAWGVDVAAGRLVELDPATLTCPIPWD